jgi:Transposase DDE domain
MSLLELFCHVDDFCQQVEPHLEAQRLQDGCVHRRRRGELCTSEMMTLLIHFHQSHYRTFKAYYIHHVQRHLCAEFPNLVGYARFVQLMPRLLGVLCAYLFSLLGGCTGVSFADSTPISVCDNRRISQHKVFAGIAQRGKSSMGWFFGFKLHLVVNERGELLGFCLTPGNRADVKVLPKLVKHLFGKVIADKGYLSQALFEQLLQQGLLLITKLKARMKNRLMPLTDKLLLRKRAIIETITDQLKNISQIEHTRHRSPVNFLVNLMGGLIAYCHQPKKPSLRLDLPQMEAFCYP